MRGAKPYTANKLVERVACTTAAPQPPEALARRAVEAGCRVFEARLDLLGYTRREARRLVEELSSRGLRVIATLREASEGGAYQGDPREKLDTLLALLDHGASLIDLEYSYKLLEEALSSAPGRVIVSHHDMRWTPPPEVIYSYAGDMLAMGARIAKIVVTARSLGDNWRVLGVNVRWPGRVAAFAMGAPGRLSRILAPLMGAALTYAVLGEPTAPGQLSLAELIEAWRLLGALGEREEQWGDSTSS